MLESELTPVPPFATPNIPLTGIVVSPLQSLVVVVLAVPKVTYVFLAVVSLLALETALFESAVLSQFPRPTCDFVTL